MSRVIVMRTHARPWLMWTQFIPRKIHICYKEAFIEQQRLKSKFERYKAGFLVLALEPSQTPAQRVLQWIQFHLDATYAGALSKFTEAGKKEWEEKYVAAQMVINTYKLTPYYTTAELKIKNSKVDNPFGFRRTAELSAKECAQAQEQQMAIKVTTPTFVNGNPESSFSTSQLIDLIRQAKASTKALIDVGEKSTTIDKLVAKEEAGIAALVKVLDAREVK